MGELGLHRLPPPSCLHADAHVRREIAAPRQGHSKEDPAACARDGRTEHEADDDAEDRARGFRREERLRGDAATEPRGDELEADGLDRRLRAESQHDPREPRAEWSHDAVVEALDGRQVAEARPVLPGPPDAARPSLFGNGDDPDHEVQGRHEQDRGDDEREHLLTP